MNRMIGRIGLLATLALSWPAAAAETERFTLGKAVPADVYIYAHGAHNPELAFLEKYQAEVWAEFHKTGVVKDVHDLIATSLPVEKREGFETFWKKAAELINGVDWGARVEEMVYASRMVPPMPEYLLLIKYEDGKAEKNAEAFSAVLKEIASAVGEEKVTYATSESHGGRVAALSFKGAEFINLRVARRESVVAIALDRTLLEESFALLAGEADKPGLMGSPRFTQAFAKLPAPEDTRVFMDFRALFGGVRKMLDFASGHAGEDPNAKQAIGVLGKAIDELNLFDTMASVGTTDGFRQVTESVVTLADDAEKSRLFKVFKPDNIEKFDRFIPKEATGYSVASGFDLSALYAAVLDFIGKEVPDGQGLLEEWERAQDSIGFHPQQDLFAWLGGQMISVSLPAVASTPFGTGDSVLFIKVRDDKLAREKVKAGMDKLSAFMNSIKQPLASQPAAIEGTEDFRSVTHPLVAMFLRPVYGVAEGYLIIGTSSEAIAACLATSRGERPSVARNERVQREGVVPAGPVASASFQDLSGVGKSVAQVLGMMSMFSAMIPDEPDSRPVKGLIGILGKLAPVAMKIDFLQSTSSATTFDGRAWRSRSVINYRPPPAEAAQ
ncbi:MAG: hypothetical protein HRF43_10655 [Phycisphaerae bacterium]|jgi:hypothetical protein